MFPCPVERPFGTEACRCKISAADLKYLLFRVERSEGPEKVELQHANEATLSLKPSCFPDCWMQICLQDTVVCLGGKMSKPASKCGASTASQKTAWAWELQPRLQTWAEVAEVAAVITVVGWNAAQWLAEILGWAQFLRSQGPCAQMFQYLASLKGN
jgi:hypothetical protein